MGEIFGISGRPFLFLPPLPEAVRPSSPEAARLFRRVLPTLTPAAQALLTRAPVEVELEPLPPEVEAEVASPLGSASFEPPADLGFPPFTGPSQVTLALPRRPGPYHLPTRPDVPVTVEGVARHELSHIALARAMHKNLNPFLRLARALGAAGQADPAFAQAVSKAHPGASALFWPPHPDLRSAAETIRERAQQYTLLRLVEGLHEYLASLGEYGGQPVRMPLPPSSAPLPDVVTQLIGPLARPEGWR